MALSGDKSKVLLDSCWVFYKDNANPMRSLGFSNGGPTLTTTKESTDIEVDQLANPIITTVTSQTLELEFPAVEISPENLKTAFPAAKIAANGRVDVYPDSDIDVTQLNGIIVIHPVAEGRPQEEPDITASDYDASKDIYFAGTASGDLNMTFAKGELLVMPITFRGTTDPLGRFFAMFNPLASEIAITAVDIAFEVGDGSGTSALSASGTDLTWYIAPATGFSLSGTTLTFASTEAGTYSTFVFCKDADGKIGVKLVTATVTE